MDTKHHFLATNLEKEHTCWNPLMVISFLGVEHPHEKARTMTIVQLQLLVRWRRPLLKVIIAPINIIITSEQVSPVLDIGPK